MSRRPSIWVEQLIERICKEDYSEEIIGDLYEYYGEVQHLNYAKRQLLFVRHVLSTVRPDLLKKPTINPKLKNFMDVINLSLKLNWRGFKANKIVTLLSLLILIIGSVSFQFVNAWLTNEKTTDQFHQNIDRIYLMTAQFNPGSDWSALDVQRIFNLDYSEWPEVSNTLKIHGYNNGEIKISNGQTEFFGTAFMADSTFFDFFDFPLNAGDVASFTDPANVFLTASYAEKLFPDQDPVGQRIAIQCDQTGEYFVAGILDDIPSNSSINFDVLIPRHSKRMWRRMPQNLIMVNEEFDQASFNQKIATLGQENQRFPESTLGTTALADLYWTHFVSVPIISKYGSERYFDNLQWVSWIIIIITVVAFVNLQTTVQLNQYKKTGLQRIIGATRSQLVHEVLTSRVLLGVTAIALASAVYYALFDDISNYLDLNLDFLVWLSIIGISMLVIGCGLLSFLAMIYNIYQQDIIDVVTGTFRIKVPQFQRMVMVVQYSFTILLLSGAMIMYLQVRSMLTMDTGVNQENIVSVDFFGIVPNQSQDSLAALEHQRKLDYVKSHFHSMPGVTAVTQGIMPLNRAYQSSWKKSGDENFVLINTMVVDPSYDDVFGLQVKEGRFFSDSLDSNGGSALIVNEAAKELLGIDDLMNARLSTNTRAANHADWQIVGVVEDYHYEHLADGIEPLLLAYQIHDSREFVVQFDPNHRASVMSELEEIYHHVNPAGIFTYREIEDLVLRQYESEKRMVAIYTLFSLVAVAITAIGLFTFTYYEAQRRTKEMGIRKVIGAEFKNVFWLMNKTFFIALTIAFLISVPVSWFFMNEWLQGYANRIEIGAWMFVAVGVFIGAVAMLTSLWSTVKLSHNNPVDSLRYE